MMRNIKFIFNASIVVALISSCSKETFKLDTSLKSAQDWYTIASKNSSIKLTSNNGLNIKVNQEVLWEEAKLSSESNGKEIVEVPLIIRYQNGENLKGNFTLLILREKNSYRTKTVYDTTNRISNTRISNQSSLENPKFFTSDKKDKHLKSPQIDKSKIKGERSMVYDSGGDPDCIIEWYLTTIWFDDWGRILDESEVYVGSTPCGSDGGGGSPPATPALNMDTINKVTDTCILAGLKKALGKNAKTKIKDLMASTFLVSSTVTLDFISFPFTNPSTINADAKTIPYSDQNTLNQQILFNENILSSKSEEYIVATVYHEILHAYFANLFTKNASGKYIIPEDHAYIVSNYLNMLISDLRTLYPSMLYEDAWALSWGGLQNTSRYDFLPQWEKDSIGSVNSQYSIKPALNSTSKGKYCK